MLADFGAFRARWVPDARRRAASAGGRATGSRSSRASRGTRPSTLVRGAAPRRSRLHPYTVDPRYFEAPPRTPRQPYAFSGGNHLRDIETLAAASALRSRPRVAAHPRLPRRSSGAARGGASCIAGARTSRAFYETLAKSRFVVLPLSRDPTCAAGITVAAMAIAAGRAVVASATPAMRDHLDDGVNALLVEPEDPPRAGRRHRPPRARPRAPRAPRARRPGSRTDVTTAETFVDVLLGP
jgi:hypothetical protein